MGNLSKKEILKEIDAAVADADKFEKDIAVQLDLIRDANILMSSAEKKLYATRRKVATSKELLIVNEGLSKELAMLRKKLVGKMKRSERKDITIAEKESLKTEIAELNVELQRLCVHNFVLVISDSYKGSSGYDYDDGRYGFRRCIVCGIGESSMSTTEESYEILLENGIRIVKRDLRHCGLMDPKYNYDEIWDNLDEFLKIFEDAAGCPYLEPKKIKLKTSAT